MFRAPIPGQSLTVEPKNFPWERPPEITDPEEAIQMHITRLSDPDTLQALLDTVEFNGVDAHTITKGILRGAVSNGIHSIDTALLAAPVVHEFIKKAAHTAGLTVEDGFEDMEAKKRDQQFRINNRARSGLKNASKAKQEMVMEEKPKPAGRRGLMARGE